MIKKIISAVLICLSTVSLMTGCVNKAEDTSAPVDTIYIGNKTEIGTFIEIN